MANNTVKYLDLVGLKAYNDKIKAWVNDRISDVNSSIADLEDIRRELTSNTNAWTAFLDGVDKSSPVPTLKTIGDTLSSLSDNKADKTDLNSYYKKTETKSASEIETAIAAVKVSATGDEEGSYIKVGASVDDAGRAITLSVDETGLSDELTALDGRVKAIEDLEIDETYVAHADISAFTADEVNNTIDDEKWFE